MPQVWRLVAAFGLVRGVIAHGESWDLLLARLCERNRISGLKRLQQIDDLLFTAGRHGSSGTISLSAIMDHSVLYLQASQSN